MTGKGPEDPFPPRGLKRPLRDHIGALRQTNGNGEMRGSSIEATFLRAATSSAKGTHYKSALLGASADAVESMASGVFFPPPRL